MPTLEFILRSEATKDLAPKRPGRTIRANGASCGELAAVDDARAAREGRGGGRFSPEPIARAESPKALLQPVLQTVRDLHNSRCTFSIGWRKSAPWRLMLAFTSEAPSNITYP